MSKKQERKIGYVKVIKEDRGYVKLTKERNDYVKVTRQKQVM